MMEFLNNFSQHIIEQLPYIVRVVAACICGAAIGYERSVRQKDAGIRTHIIVAFYTFSAYFCIFIWLFA